MGATAIRDRPNGVDGGSDKSFPLLTDASIARPNGGTTDRRPMARPCVSLSFGGITSESSPDALSLDGSSNRAMTAAVCVSGACAVSSRSDARIISAERWREMTRNNKDRNISPAVVCLIADLHCRSYAADDLLARTFQLAGHVHFADAANELVKILHREAPYYTGKHEYFFNPFGVLFEFHPNQHARVWRIANLFRAGPDLPPGAAVPLVTPEWLARRSRWLPLAALGYLRSAVCRRECARPEIEPCFWPHAVCERAAFTLHLIVALRKGEGPDGLHLVRQ